MLLYARARFYIRDSSSSESKRGEESRTQRAQPTAEWPCHTSSRVNMFALLLPIPFPPADDRCVDLFVRVDPAVARTLFLTSHRGIVGEDPSSRIDLCCNHQLASIQFQSAFESITINTNNSIENNLRREELSS